MLLLAIESSTGQVGCAVGGHEGVLASAHTSRGRRHAECLAPQIEFVCRQAQVELTDLGAVAVDVGPGLFTGLRVGIATAKALAQALAIPVIAIPSLDLLAFPARFSHRLIAAVIDARRGEIFYAFYRHVPGGVQRVSEPTLGSPDDLGSELLAAREEVLLVGDGALRYQGALPESSRIEVVEQGLANPSARTLALLAHARALREEWVQPWDVNPMYLRKPDAAIGWATRDGAAG
ncbi:MAG: tRNA (adenosine(37)-N6)-threonylcarbamoyltransferase complex dimerization subunit type 1 TsaB [Actinobacteria bacterium]|nr:tRNA (adenosine(37)-N6)-threonylcarbamoyltransferase complex dimerization subunit type 1 TsaB [Actinomycetota bacterium]